MTTAMVRYGDMMRNVRDAIKSFRKHFVAIAPLYIVFSIPNAVAPFFLPGLDSKELIVSELPYIAALALVDIVSIAIISYRIKTILENRKPSIRSEIVKSIRIFPTLLLAILLCTLAVTGGLILLILPGLYLVLRLSFTCFYVVFENMRALEAMSNSFTKTKEIQWELAGAVIILWLPVVFLQNVVPDMLNGLSIGAPYLKATSSILLSPLVALPWIAVLKYFDIANARKAQ